MGCFWSCEGGDEEKCMHCRRRAVNNLVVINQECEICLAKAKNRSKRESLKLRPLFGEFHCRPCNRKWMSRRSWQGHYQLCKGIGCGRKVYPRNLRDLRPSDMSRDKNNLQDHPKELCQMCQQLGYYCGRLRN